MSLEKPRLEHPEQRFGNCKFTRRTRVGIGVVALVGIGLVAGILIGTSMSVSAHPGFGGWGRHGGAVTIEDMRERAGDQGAWLAGFLEASVEQRQQIQAAVNNLAEQLYPLMQQHRDSRQALIAELTKPELNRQALDDLRKTELMHIDTASSRLVDGVVSVAEILTPEQRRQLASRFQR
ncbi:MAG: Spy/CpxP family protein refolding chaperone [Gammaproteobacteria bacterium]